MLDDIDEALIEAEGELNKMAAIKAQKQELMRLMAAVNDPNAYDVLKTKMESNGWADICVGTHKALKIASSGCDWAYQHAACVTRQTVPPGANVSTVGTVFAGLAGAADLLAEIAEIGILADQAILSEAEQNCILQIGKEHDKLINSVSSINGRVGTIQSQTTSLDGDIDALSGKMDTMDDKIDDIKAQTDRIETKVDTLNAKVDAMNEQMNARFDALEALLNQRLDYVDELLCTPHGNRPKLPK